MKRKKKRLRMAWYVLYSRTFSSAKSFIKSDRQAVRQEFIFVKRRSSLVCSLIVRLSLFCLSFIFTFTNMSDPTLVVREKFSQEFNLVKKMASIHYNFARKQVGDTRKRGKPKMRSLHWSAWPRPGRKSASVPHLRYLSVSRHFNE